MNVKKGLRKTLGGLFAGGATISMGFLSFAGMFLISPALGLCLSALVLAIAYEGQVYNEGISIALRRIFDENFLKKAIARRYINEQLRALRLEIQDVLEAKYTLDGDIENAFLRAYYEQKTHLADLEADHRSLTPERKQIKTAAKRRLEVLREEFTLDYIDNTFLKAYYEQKTYLAKLEANHHLTPELKQNKTAAKKNLTELELYFLKNLQNTTVNQADKLEAGVVELINLNDKEKIVKELNRKKWLVRFSWIFAIGGGISSGFAALSAIEAGVATLATTFTALSVIPGGVLITLAVFAAAGYTFMLYQTMTDMIQEYNGKTKQYFERRENENAIQHGLRIVAIGLVVGLGIFATIATAGTWWYATQKGAMVIKVGEFAADMIRNISVPLMAISTLLYNITNSLSSVDKISRSNFRKLADDFIENINKTWQEENIVQFLNPFRIIEKVICGTAKGIFFVGHLISMGLISDGLDLLPPWLNAILSGANEAPVDFNYLPNEKSEHHHSHSSMLLDIIFAPVTLVVAIFKLLAVCWDAPFSGFAGAFEKSFGHCHKHFDAPSPPALLQTWQPGHKFILNRLNQNGDAAGHGHHHGHDHDHDHSDDDHHHSDGHGHPGGQHIHVAVNGVNGRAVHHHPHEEYHGMVIPKGNGINRHLLADAEGGLTLVPAVSERRVHGR
jgi:hypothetical protein